MSFIIKKPMQLNGVKYNPGDVVTDSEVLPRRVKTLTITGYIVHVEDMEQPVVEPEQAKQDEKQDAPEQPIPTEEPEKKQTRKPKKGGDA